MGKHCDPKEVIEAIFAKPYLVIRAYEDGRAEFRPCATLRDVEIAENEEPPHTIPCIGQRRFVMLP